MKVLLTGGTGFIGQALTQELLSKHKVTLATRKPLLFEQNRVKYCHVGDISNNADWRNALTDIDVVVHLAGRAHVVREHSDDPFADFLRANVHATLNLAEQALHAGVKRFVFISSIGVNGVYTVNRPFDEQASPAPQADYARSKWQAEQRLYELINNSGMELVVIRPPLVYAGHAPGNFQRLLRLIYSGCPLPFGLVRNQRSMISLENLVSMVTLCVSHASAANETFLVSDGIDVSTPDIIRYLSKGMGRKARLLPIPVSFMQPFATIARQQRLFQQLCGSLVIDSTKVRNTLGWAPCSSPEQALVNAGRDYKSRMTSGL